MLGGRNLASTEAERLDAPLYLRRRSALTALLWSSLMCTTSASDTISSLLSRIPLVGRVNGSNGTPFLARQSRVLELRPATSPSEDDDGDSDDNVGGVVGDNNDVGNDDNDLEEREKDESDHNKDVSSKKEDKRKDSLEDSEHSAHTTSTQQALLGFTATVLSLLLGGKPGGTDGQQLAGKLLLLALSRRLFRGDRSRRPYQPSPEQHFVFERVNERYREDSLALAQALGRNGRSFAHRSRRRGWRSAPRKTVVVMELKLNDPVLPSAVVDHFRDSVTFLLAASSLPGAASSRNTDMEVVLLLESPGGSVQDFGLLSAQLSRLVPSPDDDDDDDDDDAKRGNGIRRLTVCVDRVAASGGYMIASQANTILAAPFATVGSIGVLSGVTNYRELLRRYGVNPVLLTSGERKAPLSATGEITKEGLAVVQKQMDRTHEAFRRLVEKGRRRRTIASTNDDTNNDDDAATSPPPLDVEKVSTGEAWLGVDALPLGLVDRLCTSDEYLAERVAAGDVVLRLSRYEKPVRTGFWGLSTDADGPGVPFPWDLLRRTTPPLLAVAAAATSGIVVHHRGLSQRIVSTLSRADALFARLSDLVRSEDVPWPSSSSTRRNDLFG